MSKTGKEKKVVLIRSNWPKKKTIGIQNKIIFDKDAIILLEPKKNEDSYKVP